MSHFKREFEGDILAIGEKQVEAVKSGVSFSSLSNFQEQSQDSEKQTVEKQKQQAETTHPPEAK